MFSDSLSSLSDPLCSISHGYIIVWEEAAFGMRGGVREVSLIPVIVDFLFVACLSSEHRCVESAKIRNKYPDRVPVSEGGLLVVGRGGDN